MGETALIPRRRGVGCVFDFHHCTAARLIDAPPVFTPLDHVCARRWRKSARPNCNSRPAGDMPWAKNLSRPRFAPALGPPRAQPCSQGGPGVRVRIDRFSALATTGGRTVGSKTAKEALTILRFTFPTGKSRVLSSRFVRFGFECRPHPAFWPAPQAAIETLRPPSNSIARIPGRPSSPLISRPGRETVQAACRLHLGLGCGSVRPCWGWPGDNAARRSSRCQPM